MSEEFFNDRRPRRRELGVGIASDIREDAGRLEEISFEYLREVKLTGQPDDVRRKPVVLEGDWLHWHSPVRGRFWPEKQQAWS